MADNMSPLLANLPTESSEDAHKVLEQIKHNPDFFHKAKLLQYLIRQKDFTIKQLSTLLGLQSSYICHILRLNRIPEIMVDGYYANLISISHLFMLSRIKDTEKMVQAYEKVLAESLTVLQTDALVRDVTHDVRTQGNKLSNAEIEMLIAAITRDHKNTKVAVVQTRIQSKIVVEIKGDLVSTSPILKTLLRKMSE